jgi:hypothetical protein
VKEGEKNWVSKRERERERERKSESERETEKVSEGKRE